MTKPQLDPVDLSVRQLCEAWRIMCRDSPALRQESDDGIEYFFSGLPVAFFNVAILTQPSITSAALKSLGDRARAWAAATPLPWFLSVTHEMLEPGVDATAVLAECGMAPAVPLTGMFATHVAPASKVPAGLQVGAAASDADCAAVVDINSAAYDMNLGPTKIILGKQSFWADQAASLGKVDGTPVSSATVLMVDGYRYVALVATDPAHQHHGYADAVMRHVLAAAASRYGERPTVLHATDAGRPVYTRMGYVAIATHTFFMDTALLGGH